MSDEKPALAANPRLPRPNRQGRGELCKPEVTGSIPGRSIFRTLTTIAEAISLGRFDEGGRRSTLQRAGSVVDGAPDTSAGVAELRAATSNDLGPRDSSGYHVQCGLSLLSSTAEWRRAPAAPACTLRAPDQLSRGSRAAGDRGW